MKLKITKPTILIFFLFYNLTSLFCINELDDQLLTEVKKENPNIEVIKDLVDQGANVNCIDDSGNTPLLIISKSKNSNVEVAKSLIALGANVNYSDPQIKNTPLINAAYKDRRELAKILISSGANINVLNEYDGSPLYFFVTTNDTTGLYEFVNYLLKKGADVNLGKLIPLVGATRYRHYNIAKLLISTGAEINKAEKENGTALYCVISDNYKKENFEFVRYLVSQGADVNIGNPFKIEYPLWKAVKVGNGPYVEYLITSGADVNKTKEPSYLPLREAVSKNRLDLVKILIENGSKIDFGESYILLAQLNNCSEELIQLLRSNGSKETPALIDMKIDSVNVCEKPIIIANGYLTNSTNESFESRKPQAGHVYLRLRLEITPIKTPYYFNRNKLCIKIGDKTITPYDLYCTKSDDFDDKRSFTLYNLSNVKNLGITSSYENRTISMLMLPPKQYKILAVFQIPQKNITDWILRYDDFGGDKFELVSK